MNLRFLTPGIAALLGLVLAILYTGNIQVLKDNTFQVFISPFFIIFYGWFIHQGFKFYWTLLGIYHCSIYHEWIRKKVKLVFDRENDKYRIDLSQLGLKPIEDLSKEEFEIIFDPFKLISEKLPFFRYPKKRKSYLKNKQLPFVACLDNFILYNTSFKDTPGKRWTDFMIFISSIFAILAGFISCWIFNFSIDSQNSLSFGPFNWLSGLSSLVLLAFLGVPAILQATVISWGEAKSYELLALMIKKLNS